MKRWLEDDLGIAIPLSTIVGALVAGVLLWAAIVWTLVSLSGLQ